MPGQQTFRNLYIISRQLRIPSLSRVGKTNANEDIPIYATWSCRIRCRTVLRPAGDTPPLHPHPHSPVSESTTVWLISSRLWYEHHNDDDDYYIQLYSNSIISIFFSLDFIFVKSAFNIKWETSKCVKFPIIFDKCCLFVGVGGSWI